MMTREERQAIRAQMAYEREALRMALEVEHGVATHSKAARLFELAWEFGHSAGHAEVRSYYGQLVDLLLDGGGR